ncbi:MAG: ATP-dependent DNA ligase, partial [Halobacteriales archaeon]
RLGRPVRAMLAQTGSVTEALAEWDRAGVEWKYDGARVQVHYDPDGLGRPEAGSRTAAKSTGGDSAGAGTDPDREVALYSRNMEDVTDPLPEVVEFVADNCTAPAILDAEVVAVDDDGDPLPFQEVLRRFRRKHDVAAAREEVAVDLWAFDCLHADGTDLLDAPLTERRDRLESVLPARTSEFRVADDAETVEAIEERALAAGHEGIMLKDPDSAYTPGRRGKNWLKRKPDVETLDLVVTGAEWGEGRRANLLGTFLLSARTPDGYETIGKVATGITDERLAALTDLLEPHVRSEDGQEVDLEPAVVFEVGYEEIQASPTYSSGYALRFPRFRTVRDDVAPAEADTMERIERLANRQ